jgi:hypothetical protein
LIAIGSANDPTAIHTWRSARAVLAAEVKNRLADPLGGLQGIVPKLQQLEAMIDRHYARVMV